MTLNTRIRLLQWFNHIVAIPAIGYVVYTAQWHWLVIALASWLVIGPVSTVITLHRLLTHRSFKTYDWLEQILTFITIFTTVGPTIAWVAVHRMHHAYSDTSHDPHSPNVNKQFNKQAAMRVWLGYEWHIVDIPIKFVKDLMRKPIHKWIYNNYFTVIFAVSAVLLLIDPMLWLFVYVVPASLTVHLIGLVNVCGHSHGYRNHNTADCSTNSWIANLASLGEGWHNNHHAHPTNWYAGEKWWEWDLMGLIIKLIKR